jgi:uncharacterized protein (TIGR00290 family)
MSTLSKAIFNWSTGKDSAMALYQLQLEKQIHITTLLTSVSTEFNRVSMHGVRVELLEKQAEMLGLPLIKMEIQPHPSMEEYESVMKRTLLQQKNNGVELSVFGDIFLADLRKYREEKLESIGLKGIFPLWNRSTNELIKEFIGLGFKAITTCVNDRYLGQEFVGRELNEAFIKDLPVQVDPCGENGEFHTFVYDGPNFSSPIQLQLGEIIHRTYPAPKESSDTICETDKVKSVDTKNYGFWYCDLLLKE